MRTGLRAGFKVTAGIFKSLFFVYCVSVFYPYILLAIEKQPVLCYNTAIQLLLPYMTCRCKRHFIEEQSSRPLFIGAYGIAKIQMQCAKAEQRITSENYQNQTLDIWIDL